MIFSTGLLDTTLSKVEKYLVFFQSRGKSAAKAIIIKIDIS
jgi:hypothetical protein